MKIADISGITKTVKSTKRFVKDFKDFIGKYSKFGESFSSFLSSKTREMANTKFNQKDSPLVGTLSGYWKCHLIHGKAIIIYKNEPTVIKLYAVVEHNDIEGNSKSMTALADYLNSLGSNDFINLNFHPELQDKKLSPAQYQEIMSLAYEMAIDDRDILESMANGDPSDFVSFASMILDNIPKDQSHRMIMNTFDGIPGLAKLAKTVLNQIPKAIRESLSSPFPWKLDDQFGLESADFKSETREYHVSLNGSAGISVSFNSRKLGTNSHYSMQLTGEHDGLRVFSTVYDIIKDAIRRRNPNWIAFEARKSEPSRIKLYRALASRLAKGLGWKVEEDDGNREMIFTISKN